MRLPWSAISVPLPWVPQPLDYDCGRSLVASVLCYAGVGVNYPALLKALLSHPEHGTDPEPMVEVLQRGGIKCKLEEDMDADEIVDSLAQSHPVLVSLMAYGTEHWMACVGTWKKNVVVFDPAMEYGVFGYIPWPKFKRNWKATTRSGALRSQLGIVARVQRRATVPARLVPVP